MSAVSQGLRQLPGVQIIKIMVVGSSSKCECVSRMHLFYAAINYRCVSVPQHMFGNCFNISICDVVNLPDVTHCLISSV